MKVPLICISRHGSGQYVFCCNIKMKPCGVIVCAYIFICYDEESRPHGYHALHSLCGSRSASIVAGRGNYSLVVKWLNQRKMALIPFLSSRLLLPPISSLASSSPSLRRRTISLGVRAYFKLH